MAVIVNSYKTMLKNKLSVTLFRVLRLYSRNVSKALLQKFLR